MKKVIVIFGESGSGKSALKKAIMRLQEDYHEVVTSTTRPMRENEENGRDYFFYTEEEMKEKIFKGEMAECVVFRDWVYGTEYDKIVDGQINIGVWNPEGTETLNDDYDLDCLNVYVYAPPKVRLLRSLNREENPNVDEIVRRYEADKKDFRQVDINYILTVTNDGSKSIDDIAKEVVKYAEKCFGQTCSRHKL